MYSALLLVLVFVCLPLVWNGFRQWRHSRATLILFPLLALAGGLLETVLGAAGHLTGPATALAELYAFPLLIRLFVLPMTLFTLATLARRAGFGWARPDWGHGAVCILAVVLLIASLGGVLALKAVVPVCWRDVVWYAWERVPEGLVCAGAVDTPSGAVPRLPAVAATVVLLAWLAHGLALWWRFRWPWLLLGMVAGLSLLQSPPVAGPVPWLAGQLAVLAAILHSSLHEARRTAALAGRSAGAAGDQPAPGGDAA